MIHYSIAFQPHPTKYYSPFNIKKTSLEIGIMNSYMVLIMWQVLFFALFTYLISTKPYKIGCMIHFTGEEI